MSDSVKELKSTAREPVLSNAAFGTLLLLVTELMLFIGFISSYTVARAEAAVWPPPDQPRLPIEATAAFSMFLLISGVSVVLWVKTHSSPVWFKRNLLLTIVGGSAFLLCQGYEWVNLIAFGLTTHSSLYGSFFYLIIGCHALHVLVGLLILLSCLIKLKDIQQKPGHPLLTLASMYWLFVVLLWPLLYVVVYVL